MPLVIMFLKLHPNWDPMVGPREFGRMNNEITFNKDGTGSYWNGKTGITNNRLIWKIEGNRIRIDRWLISMHEATMLKYQVKHKSCF